MDADRPTSPTSLMRAYRFVLRAYPRAMRERFEIGMLDALAQDVTNAKQRGWLRVAVVVAMSVSQAVWFGVVERIGRRSSPFQDVATGRRRIGSGMSIELRDAYRSLRAAPLVTVVAVGSLALGIGANTSLFSILNGLVLKPLPVHDPERLALLEPGSFSNPVWEEIRDRYPRLTAGAFAWSVERFNVADGGEMDFVDGIYASGSMFDVLGVRAALGRTFQTRDDVPGGGPEGRVALISHALWQRRYSGAQNIVGRSITIDRHPFTIVGVLPASFFGPDVGRLADIILPVGSAVGLRRAQLRTAATWMNIMVRLQSDQTIDQAADAFRAAQSSIRISTQPPDRPPGQHLTDPFTLVPAANGRSTLRQRYETPLAIILSVVGIVLLSACANLANLLLARATARQTEFSLRLALGASRWRVARQLLVESLMLAAAGSALGLLIAQWGSALLVRQLATSTVAVMLDLAIDGRVLSFTIAAALVTSVLLGVAPAIGLARLAEGDVLKSHGRGVMGDPRSFTRNMLLISQVALSLVLVVAAALFLRSFVTLASVPLGFDPERLIVVAVDIERRDGPAAPGPALAEQLRDAVASVPGVVNAALSYTTPLTNRGWNGFIRMPGAAPATDSNRLSWVNIVSPGWFSTYGIRLIRGRDIGLQDVNAAERVAVVNEAFLNRFFPGQDGIGLRFAGGTADQDTQTIVGVVSDAIYRSQRAGAPPTMYVPWAQQENFPTFSITARAAGSAAALRQPIAAALAREDPAVAFSFRRFGDQYHATVVQERLVTWLSGFFGGLALLLAALGLYGVTSYAVGRRRAELGVRLALGAGPRDIRRIVLGRVVWLVGLGIVAGLALSYWAGRFIQSQLFEVEARDPAMLAIASAVLFAIGVLAGWLPARRAARIDPVIVLRG
jgi:putative ABC transport system permease protein